MLLRVAAKEEESIEFLIFSPGIVDTDMQKWIRENGQECMETESWNFFMKKYENKELIDPMDPAAQIGVLFEQILQGRGLGKFGLQSGDFVYYENLLKEE